MVKKIEFLWSAYEIECLWRRKERSLGEKYKTSYWKVKEGGGKESKGKEKENQWK